MNENVLKTKEKPIATIDFLKNKKLNKRELYRKYIIPENVILYFKDRINWNFISQYQVLSHKFMHMNKSYINWKLASKYQRLSELLIKMNYDKVNWTYVSKYQRLSEKFIDTFATFIDWSVLNSDNITPYIMEKYGYNTDIDWCDLFLSKDFDKIYVDRFKNRMHTPFINTGYNHVFINGVYLLTEDIIREVRYTDFDKICKFSTLSEEFIAEYADRLDWGIVCKYQHLSEKFIEKFSNKVVWKSIAKYQSISENFISKHKNQLDHDLLCKYRQLSKDFINSGTININWDIVIVTQDLSEEMVINHRDQIHNVEKLITFQSDNLSKDFYDKYINLDNYTWK